MEFALFTHFIALFSDLTMKFMFFPVDKVLGTMLILETIHIGKTIYFI